MTIFFLPLVTYQLITKYIIKLMMIKRIFIFLYFFIHFFTFESLDSGCPACRIDIAICGSWSRILYHSATRSPIPIWVAIFLINCRISSITFPLYLHTVSLLLLGNRNCLAKVQRVSLNLKSCPLS